MKQNRVVTKKVQVIAKVLAYEKYNNLVKYGPNLNNLNPSDETKHNHKHKD